VVNEVHHASERLVKLKNWI